MSHSAVDGTITARRGVALVLVSHSGDLARGARELAGQMAPDVEIIAAGGTGDGLGTSFDLIEEAITAASAEGRSVVVLTDLGSAVLTTESVLEFADEDVVARVRLADAPFVEGAVAAAVAANGGSDLDAVLAAAVGAGRLFSAEPASAPATAVDGAALSATVTVRNPLGLHARPAALLARMVATFDASVTVNGVDASSVLELMKLGTTGGQQLAVKASGPQADAALRAVIEAVDGGFGET